MSFGKFRDGKATSDSSARETSDSTSSKIRDFSKTDSSSSSAILGHGCKVVGQLSFEGPAEIGGDIEGEISSSDSLVIAETAVIKASISGRDITIHGSVIGDISATGRIALKKPARIAGNISSPVLSIEEGVVFQGSCAMPADQTQVSEDTAKAVGSENFE